MSKFDPSWILIWIYIGYSSKRPSCYGNQACLCEVFDKVDLLYLKLMHPLALIRWNIMLQVTLVYYHFLAYMLVRISEKFVRNYFSITWNGKWMQYLQSNGKDLQTQGSSMLGTIKYTSIREIPCNDVLMKDDQTRRRLEVGNAIQIHCSCLCGRLEKSAH